MIHFKIIISNKSQIAERSTFQYKREETVVVLLVNAPSILFDYVTCSAFRALYKRLKNIFADYYAQLKEAEVSSGISAEVGERS